MEYDNKKLLDRLSEIEKNVLNEVRQQSFSSAAISSPPPIVGSNCEVSSIELLNKSIPNIILQLNEVKDKWGQNYSTLVAILSDIDQIVSGSWQGYATRDTSVKNTVVDKKLKEVAESGMAIADNAGASLKAEIGGLNSTVTATGAAIQTIMNDVGVKIASAFSDKTDAAMKAIVDSVGAKLAATVKDISDPFVKDFMDKMGSKLASGKANPGVKAAIDGTATRLASAVARATDSDLKTFMDEEIVGLDRAITAAVGSGVKAVMGNLGTGLASTVTGKIRSVVKAEVENVGPKLTSAVTNKLDTAVKTAMDGVDKGLTSIAKEIVDSTVTAAIREVSSRLASAVTNASDSVVKDIIDGISTKIIAAVTKASDSAVNKALAEIRVRLVDATDAAMTAAVSGSRLSSDNAQKFDSAVQTVMDGVSTELISAMATAMGGIGVQLASAVTEVTDSAVEAVVDRVGKRLQLMLSDIKGKGGPSADVMKRDPADLDRLLSVLDRISSISKPFNNDPDAVWIASTLHKLVSDVLFSACVLLMNLSPSSRKEKNAQLSGVLKTLTSMGESTVTSKVIIEVSTMLSEVMADHTKEVVASGALIAVGAVKSILTMKVDEDLIKGLTRGAVAAFEVFLHMKATERLDLLVQVTPQRAPTEPLLPLSRLKAASETMAKATGNWLVTCQYLNTLSKVSFVAFQNLLSEKSSIHHECLRLLQAAIVGGHGVIGIVPLLKKHSQKNQPNKADFLLNTICNAESLSGMLQSAASEALGELMESVEKISEDVFNALKKSVAEFLQHVNRMKDRNASFYPNMSDKLAILRKLKLMLNGLLDLEEWMYLFERSISKVQGHLIGLKGAISAVVHFFNLFRNVQKYNSKAWIDKIKESVAQVEQSRFNQYAANQFTRYAEYDSDGKFSYHYYLDNYGYDKHFRYINKPPPGVTRRQWDEGIDIKTFENIWSKLEEVKLTKFEKISFMTAEYVHLIPNNFVQPKFEGIWNQFDHLGGGELETAINGIEKLCIMTQRCGEAIDQSVNACKEVKSALFKERDYSITNKVGVQHRKYILKFWDSLPEDIDTLKRFIEVNDREEDRVPALSLAPASNWIFQETHSSMLGWSSNVKKFEMDKVMGHVHSTVKSLIALFIMKPTKTGMVPGTVTEKIQQTSATIQYISQLLNKLEDLFSDVSKMNAGELGSLVATAMELNSRDIKEQLTQAIKKNIMKSVADGMIQLKSLTELKGFDGWWQPLSHVWEACTDNMGAMSTLRDALPKLLGPGSNPRLVEEAAVSALLNLFRIAKELSLVEPAKLGWSSELCAELSDLLNLMTISVSKVQANSPNTKVQNLFKQDINRGLMKHAMEKSWLRIEEETIKSRNESVENFQEFEKVCKEGERKWTSTEKVGFVDSTHEMLKANDIQNAVDATKSVAEQLQNCQAGLSGLSPIILSKMNRHTREITRIRKVILEVLVTVTPTAPDPKRYRCIGCSYVSSCMDQKTLKLDNLIDKMDRLKVPWSPKPDGDAKAGSTVADVRNLRIRNSDERNSDEFDIPNPSADNPRQIPRYQSPVKRPASAAPSRRK
eukprot:gene27679-36491_t